MKKRRTFDIDLPDEPVAAPPTEERATLRRSPMAAAITENADSLRERQAVEAEIRAENDALAQEHVRLKRMGLITDLVPLDLIDSWKLTRDRASGEDGDLDELVESLRDIGLSNPIRVEQKEDGRYELIQGFRRLTAYRTLLAETGDAARWAHIPAGILPRGEGLEGLYRRMVDENLVRKDISFAEMAQLALNYAQDPGTRENDPDRVVAELFKSAGYQKRSYIRQFIRLMAALGQDLVFAPQIPRALGLKLASAIESRPELVAQIRAALLPRDERSAAEEMEVLRGATASLTDDVDDGENLPATKPAKTGQAKTTFQVTASGARAKCTAANGRLEIKLDRDFTAVDRRQLEAAVQRLLQDLA